MVDERARAARADAVHALLRRVAEIRDLRVLAAELHDRIRLRDELLHSGRAGDDLLHERQADALGDAHARGAREREGELLLADDLLQRGEILMKRMADLREMTLVVLVDDLLRLVEHDEFDGRRTDINPYIKK